MAGRDREDVAAYSDLVTARSSSLFHTAYLMVGDHQLAQDLLQEALVKTYVAWPRLRDVTKAEAYTHRVDELATRDALWAQLHLLAPRQRAAIVCRYYLDLSEAQTAEAMGCSVGAVKSQTSVGLDRLRDRMGPDVALFTTTDQRRTP